MSQHRTVAEAFSGHRFTATYPHLAEDVIWVARGESTTVGREAVVAACETAAAELAAMTTNFSTFRTVDGGDTIAVETVGRYVDKDGAVSNVASCDLYTFDDGRLTEIVSYAVEVDDPARGR
jgi:ketosteroid isomerase-like protein